MACPCAQPTCNECNPCTPPNPCDTTCVPPPFPTCQDECELPIYSSEGCSSTPPDNCIAYTGDNNICLNIVKPMSIKQIFAKIFLYLKNIFSNVNSQSLVITPSGDPCNSSLNIEIAPSGNTNNIFILGTDNRPFVPKLEIGNGQCITFIKTIVNNKIIYTPQIDIGCLSGLLCPICSGDVTICPAPINLNLNLQ